MHWTAVGINIYHSQPLQFGFYKNYGKDHRLFLFKVLKVHLKVLQVSDIKL